METNPASKDRDARLLRILDLFIATGCGAIGVGTVAVLYAAMQAAWSPAIHRTQLATIALASLTQCAILAWPGLRRHAGKLPVDLGVLAVLLVELLLLQDMLRGVARVSLAILATVWFFCTLSIWFRHGGLAVTASAVALIGFALLAPEWPPHAIWSDRLTFRYLFPK